MFLRHFYKVSQLHRRDESRGTMEPANLSSVAEGGPTDISLTGTPSIVSFCICIKQTAAWPSWRHIKDAASKPQPGKGRESEEGNQAQRWANGKFGPKALLTHFSPSPCLKHAVVHSSLSALLSD